MEKDAPVNLNVIVDPFVVVLWAVLVPGLNGACR